MDCLFQTDPNGFTNTIQTHLSFLLLPHCCLLQPELCTVRTPHHSLYGDMLLDLVYLSALWAKNSKVTPSTNMMMMMLYFSIYGVIGFFYRQMLNSRYTVKCSCPAGCWIFIEHFLMLSASNVLWQVDNVFFIVLFNLVVHSSLINVHAVWKECGRFCFSCKFYKYIEMITNILLDITL